MSTTKFGKILASFVCLVVAVFCLCACNLGGGGTEAPEVTAKKEAEQQAQEVLNKLVWDAEDRTAIVESISLTTSNKNYPTVSISWASSEPDVISETGKVTRPSFNDERAYADGENNVVKVILTATVVATYDSNTTDPISKQFEFTVQTMPEGLDTGSIADVKARAWTYVYETNGVKKTLATNNEFVYQVQLTGIVTAKLNADTRGFMIHDGSDGIYVYASNADLNIGDTVTVTGGVYTYYGSLQVGSDISWEKVDPVDGMTLPEYTVTTPTVWEAKNAPVDGVFADDVIGHFGGDLYKVEGLLVRKDAPAGSGKYCIVDPATGEETWIYYKSYTPEMEEELKANVDKYVRVPGVSYDRDSRINKNEILFVGGIEEATAPEVTDEQKANVILQQITLKAEYQEDFELSAQGTWEVVSGTGIEIVDGVAKVTRGDEDQTVVLKVTVTVGEAVVSKELTVVVKAVVKETPKHAGTKEDPYTASDALLVAGELAEGATSEAQYYVYGQIVSIKEVSTSYGNATFNISDGKNEFICYRAKYLNGEAFTAEDQIKVGDYVVVVGNFTNYKGTLEFAAGCYVDLFGEIVVETPLKEGQAYKFQMVQTAAGKTVYFTGEMNGFYYNTSEDINAGVDVYVEVVEGGYNLYFLDAAGTKHYMGIVVSEDGAHVNAVFDQEKTVFTYNEELETVVAVVNEEDYIFGTRNDKTYVTIGATKASSDPFYAKFVVAGENPGHEHVYVEGKCECGAEDPNYTPVMPSEGLKEGQAYKFQLVQTLAGKTVYFTGEMNGFYYNTSEDINAGVDVYVEVVEGGYKLYFLDAAGAKHYMGIVTSADGAHVNAVYDQEETVFTYSEELKTLVAVVNEEEYVFGTRNDKTYTTIGANKVSYDPFYVTFVVEGEPSGHEHVYVEGKCECGAEDPNYNPVEPSDKEVTIAEALQLADGAAVVISGTVIIVEAWNAQYGNMNFTIKDATGEMYVYACAKVVVKGDIVTITGVMGTYNSARQIAKGAECEITGHDSSYDPVAGAAVITFDDKAKRTEYSTSIQVWEENGLVVTNEKASSTSNVGDYVGPARFYKSSSLKVEAENAFTTLVITCGSASYATALQAALTGDYTVKVSGSLVTITFAEATNEFFVESLSGGQVRVVSIEAK